MDPTKPIDPEIIKTKDLCITGYALAKFKDQQGNTIPFITFCYLEGAEPAMVDNIWQFDFRKQGGRTLNVYVSTTYGIEFHRPTALGLLTKQSTN